MSAAAVDRRVPPPPGELRPFRFPEFVRTRLANGLRIVAARAAHVPLVNLEVLVAAGGQYSAAAQAGLASFHAGLLDEGSDRHTAQEIASRVEQLGGSLSSGADWDVAWAATTLQARHLDDGLDLLAEVLRRPSFPEDEIERLRGQRLAELLRRKDQPQTIADWRFVETVYGSGVYGRPLIGTDATVEAFDRDAVAAFYRRHVAPAAATLLAIGDLDPDRVIERVGEHFADWPSRPTASRPSFDVQPLDGNRVVVVDRPAAAQSQLELGHAGVPRSHPDHPKLVVLNALLGGKFTSRINLNLRERHGYTYGAYSQFLFRQGPGPFVVTTAVANEVVGAAVREILHEIRRLRDEPVTAAELRETQDYLIGVFPTTLQTASDVAHRLETLLVHDLPDDYYETYPACLAEVTAEDLLEAARRHLHPDRLAIVVVGPEAVVRPQL